LYVLVLVLRGLADFVAWFAENYLASLHRRQSPAEKPAESLHKPKPLRRQTLRDHQHATQPKTDVPLSVAPTRRPSPLTKLRKRLGLLLGSKNYDRWVTAALSEEDLTLKVEYLSRALKLNPKYLPAWGLKANALVDLGKFEEAIGCFEQSLGIRPSALTWYRKGLCCHRLGRHAEAVECFEQAISTCHDDPQLRQDAARMKRLVTTGLASGNH
jgi:tetratricopeptide (TPR) repeat protein